ncbi:MAG TPA: peptidoglycan editing factor PgeF [Bacteroidia bacterium]|nr:peptidoglycan editing factor PgeF [Bacteroidia bacterium]
MILKPQILNAEEVIAAQSTRLDGVSPVPFQSLNLGLSVQDDEKNVHKNRELFFGALEISPSQVALSHQVHQNKVKVVERPGRSEGYDVQITDKRGVFLAVSIADCAPILIHDERNDAVAAVHAGWRGTTMGAVTNALKQMKRVYGTNGRFCKAYIGACISFDAFEVGEEVAVNFGNEFKRFDEEKKKWFVDLKEANKKQLLDFGISRDQIEVSEYCTVKNNDLFFSHRKEQGKTGRMMAVIGLKAD